MKIYPQFLFQHFPTVTPLPSLLEGEMGAMACWTAAAGTALARSDAPPIAMTIMRTK